MDEGEGTANNQFNTSINLLMLETGYGKNNGTLL
jgi:hypothetical protein